MKAIVVTEPGGPEKLTLTEVPDPVPGPGEVVVQVAATALNRADLLQRRGLYPPPPGASELLGLECAGTIAALGEGCTAALGQEVMALLPGGGYAERVVVPERLLMPVPRGYSMIQAAAIPEAFLTAREALFGLGVLSPGQTVLIHAAAGGVGSAAVQLAVQAGANVVATCGSSDKAERIRALGAHLVIDYKNEDFVAGVNQASGGRGADLVLDFVGAAYWEKHVRCLAAGGKCVIIGLLGGTRAQVDFSHMLTRRLQLLGLVMRTRSLADKVAMTGRFVRESLPLFEQGRLHAIVDSSYPLARAAEAHSRMEQNANIGKIVLTID